VNDPQYPKVIFGNRNTRGSAERFSSGDELEDPVVALVVHGHLIVVIDGVSGGAAGGFESFKKWIQEQDHNASPPLTSAMMAGSVSRSKTFSRLFIV
jgi:hypothetical protein